MTLGTVFLVGAGPGDPELISLKGSRLLQSAECVLYDSLANPRFLDLVPPEAERVHVGKRGDLPSPKQDEINEIILEKARRYERVVRLKGGDPYIFGRGGEEALFLESHGVPFEVVPGVTAAVAAGACAGFPATHRGLATTFAVATGMEDPTKSETQTDWGALGRAVGTLAVYMTIRQLPTIVDRILEGGRSPDTPAALIENATLPIQRTVVGTLGSIVQLAKSENVRPPAIFLLGEVIHLRDRLNWFETRPFFGKRILVTRPPARVGRFRTMLENLGALVLEMPTITIAPPDDFGPLDRAVDALAGVDWLVFTSPAGVSHFFARLDARKLDARALGASRVAAIGPGTAEELRQRGVRPDFIPSCFTSATVADELCAGEDLSGKHVLLPRADIATDVLPDALQARGARLTRVVAYRTIPCDCDPELIAALAEGRIDAVTFTSASTADNFIRALDRAPARPHPSVRMVSIGPVTSARMRELGLPVTIEADPHDLSGLAAALVASLHSA